MSDQTLFDEQNKDTPETPANPQTDPLADLLREIRNEQGEQKYKDIPTALKALANSQQFIRQLQEEKRSVEEEKERVRAELEKMGTIDDYVKRLQPNNATADQPKETPKGDGGLSEERVAQLLEERLTARERQAVATANLSQVETHLKQTHGERAAEFLKQRASELNISVTDLKELAMKTPSAALALLGGEVKKPVVPSQSSVIPPRQAPDDNPFPQFERSVVHGGLTNEELKDRWKQAKAYTHKRLKVEE